MSLLIALSAPSIKVWPRYKTPNFEIVAYQNYYKEKEMFTNHHNHSAQHQMMQSTP